MNNKLLIVDDHMMIRDGISLMIESQKPRLNFVVYEAENGEEAVRRVKSEDFDIIIMDYKLPGMNGADATKQITSFKPGTKILALSNSDEYASVKNMIRSGARGFILKNISPIELATAIEAVLKDKHYYSNEIAYKVLMDEDPGKVVKKDGDTILTKRQLEILKLITQEMTNEEIANKLNLSVRTVKNHRNTMMHNLKIKNSTGLIKYAYSINLID